MKSYRAGLLFWLVCDALAAADLVVKVADDPKLSRQVFQYQCDEGAKKVGLPAGPFPIEYINGGGNSLAVIPIRGKRIIFSGIISGSGARYAAQELTWMDAAGRVSLLLSDSPAGKFKSICQRVKDPG